MEQGRGRAAIVGGSIAGLFAALLLRRRGWSVTVFERATEALSGRGAGIVTHDQLDRVLALAGAAPAEGVMVHHRIVYGRDGATVASADYPQRMTSWDRLWRRLREALPDAHYRTAAEFAALHPTPDGVTLHLADGTTHDADLLIGADGIRSSVRTALAGPVEPAYAGYVAWRGLVPEADLPQHARDALFDALAFSLPPGEQMVGYPVAGEGEDLRPGHLRYNWVWYRPAEPGAALPDLLTDRAGRRHALAIPPPLIRDELIRSMQRDAETLLAPCFVAVAAATPRPFLQPIYDLESPIIAQGRVALLGDAAFVARPHVGAGTTKAAEDALALAEALDTADIPTALAAYQSARRPAGQRLLHRARHLGAYLQAHTVPGDDPHQTAESVLAETATLTF